MYLKNTILLLFVLAISSCESELEKKQRIEHEEQKRIEIEAKIKKKKEEQAIYNEFIDSSLNTGAMPYSYCFGRNNSCASYGCSKIIVSTPSNSDVLVIIKKDNEVYRHAYIKSNSQYTFEFPNGTYQTFFYYGKGWNPNKVMKETSCGTLKGGFITQEHIGKDSPQIINNNILEYQLILQQNGNFSTRPSNSEEAF